MATETALIRDLKLLLIIYVTVVRNLSAAATQTPTNGRWMGGNKETAQPTPRSGSRSVENTNAQQFSSSSSNGFKPENTGLDSDLALYLSDYYANSNRMADTTLSPMTDWAELYATKHLHSPSHYEQRCVPIPADMALCRGMNYADMRLPNELGHGSLDEVRQHALSWLPLVNVHCHPDTRLFLCSLFAPVCPTIKGQGDKRRGQGQSSRLLTTVILPCRSLCEAVRDGCRRTMQRYNFTWPALVNCQRFPAHNSGMCIEPQYTNSKPEGDSCMLCKRQPDTVESIIDQYCTADFVLRVEIVANTTVYTDGRLDVTSRKKVFKGNLTKTALRRGQFIVENVTGCRCRFLARHSQSRNRRYVIMGSAIRDGQLIVNFLKSLSGSKSLQLTRALRLIRKSPDICISSSKIKVKTITQLNKEKNMPGINTKPDKTTSATKTIEKFGDNHSQELVEQQE